MSIKTPPALTCSCIANREGRPFDDYQSCRHAFIDDGPNEYHCEKCGSHWIYQGTANKDVAHVALIRPHKGYLPPSNGRRIPQL